VLNDPTGPVREAIRDTMTKRGISEARLSADALIPRSTLTRKLAGVSPISVEELFRIAAALDLTLRDLIAPADAA